jgi:hypothetical protein
VLVKIRPVGHLHLPTLAVTVEVFHRGWIRMCVVKRLDSASTGIMFLTIAF